MYTDRSITCADCGQEFTFTAGEQEFYAQRGFTESPKRCPSCRQIRKAQRSRSSSFDGGSSRGDGYGSGYRGSDGYGDAAYAADSVGGGYSASGGYSAGGYSSSGGGYSGGGYPERRQREMFEAVCANCGRTASVPFRPSGSKPVYCSDCFESRR